MRVVLYLVILLIPYKYKEFAWMNFIGIPLIILKLQADKFQGFPHPPTTSKKKLNFYTAHNLSLSAK